MEVCHQPADGNVHHAHDRQILVEGLRQLPGPELCQLLREYLPTAGASVARQQAHFAGFSGRDGYSLATEGWLRVGILLARLEFSAKFMPRSKPAGGPRAERG